MSYLTKKRIYYIDSHNRTTGTHENFLYEIVIPPNEGYDHVVILSAVIPKSYYLVQSPYNTFTLQEEKKSATVTITPGNYSATSFRTNLTTLLNSTSPSGWTYTITFPNSTTDAQTAKFTYSVTGNSGGQASFIFPSTSKIYEQMGFDSASTNSFTSSLTSTNVVKFQLEDTLYIISDIANNGKDNILQEVFISSSPDYSSIKYQCPDVEAYSKEITTTNNNVYSFKLTDEDGNLMSLNGLNMVFTLLLYKKENLSDILKNYLKLKIIGNK